MSMNDLGTSLAAEIRAERARQQRTMEDIYSRAGLSKSAYIRIETGQRGARMDQLEAIAAALDVPLSELVSRAEARAE